MTVVVYLTTGELRIFPQATSFVKEESEIIIGFGEASAEGDDYYATIKAYQIKRIDFLH